MEFDTKKINTDLGDPYYNVSYILYSEEKGFDKTHTFESLQEAIDAKKIKGKVLVGEACFRGMRHSASTNTNRILLKVNFKHRKEKGTHLDIIERKKWVNLCKHHGLLPGYTDKHFVKTGNFILRFDDLSISKIYMYLTAARYLQEFPHTAKAVLYLRKKGLNFFLALLAASRCTVANKGHSFYKQAKPYACSCDPNSKKVKVRPVEALALKAYIQNKHDHDSVPFSKLLKTGNKREMQFQLQTTLEKFYDEFDSDFKAVVATIPQLFDEEIQNKLK
jgi:hypothetical protein